jgi:tRNA1(Val) A37 N6-methylase TrmN6
LESGADVPELATTQDAFLGGRLTLRQPAEGYRAAIDPVLLAAAIPAKVGDRIVDLGCGVGTAGLCLLTRLPGTSCVGIELQQILAALALENAAANGLAGRYLARCGSIMSRPVLADLSGAEHVIANPPYLPQGEASVSAHPIKALANVESDATLADWVEAASALVKPGGAVTFIHRADRLPDLVACMRERLGSLVILPILPKAGMPASRVILRGRKDKRAPAQLLAPLVLHEPGGAYTAMAEAILRDAATLRV